MPAWIIFRGFLLALFGDVMSPDPETRLVWIQSFTLLTFVTPSLIRFQLISNKYNFSKVTADFSVLNQRRKTVQSKLTSASSYKCNLPREGGRIPELQCSI